MKCEGLFSLKKNMLATKDFGMWPCVQLLCAEHNAPCQRDLAVLQHLQQNDRAMIRQICNVRPQDIVTTRSNELLVRLGIEDLDLFLKERRLRWYGHVESSNGQDSL